MRNRLGRGPAVMTFLAVIRGSGAASRSGEVRARYVRVAVSSFLAYFVST